MTKFLTDLAWADFQAEHPDLARECAEQSPSAVGKPLTVKLVGSNEPERYCDLITLIPGSQDGFPVMFV